MFSRDVNCLRTKSSSQMWPTMMTLASQLWPVVSAINEGRHQRGLRATTQVNGKRWSLLSITITLDDRRVRVHVIVIGLDFSKAFDTLRHDTLLNKMAQLDIANPIYNWLVDYFSAHQHSMRFRGSMSQLLEITAQHHAGLGDRPSLLCRQRVGSLGRYARKLHV